MVKEPVSKQQADRWPLARANVPKLFERLQSIAQPSDLTSPDMWALSNRRYPPSAAVPGPCDPFLTPYMVPFGRAVASRDYRRVVMVCGSQMGKTDTFLSAIGQRLDQDPAPILYVGPNRQFLLEQFEPRIIDLLDEAPSLKEKVARGKRMTKTRKVIAGVPLRLAHAGSSTALKSDPAALALVDEYDEMLRNVKGQGDPLGLVEARGDTYADFTVGVTSTPSHGIIEIETDEASGLQFWAVGDAEDIASPIWRLWQQGTRHHWCWPCPQCGEYFVPRMSLLRIPDGATPVQARQSAFIECPRCHGVIEDHDKAGMNERGVYVAPGQSVSKTGEVSGHPVAETSTLSLWVSGLASPFVTIGQRAETLVTARASGEQSKIQTATNAAFGEVFVQDLGEVPGWQEIMNRAEPYPAGVLPEEAIHPILTVDVQKDRLVYVTRAWGARATSWLIEHGELLGDTAQTPVWGDLASLITEPIDGLPIRLVFIDSGFRPGKKITLPLNRVYAFCRRFRRFVYPSKGSSRPMLKPLVKSKPDVDRQGEVAKYGLELIRLDTDHWKSFVHERLTWPTDQLGAWHIHADVSEDYCRQLVAEARIVSDSGSPTWVEKSKANHYLDCEAMNAAAGFMLNVHHLKPGARRRAADEEKPAVVVPETAAAAVVAKQPRFSRFANMAARLNGDR